MAQISVMLVDDHTVFVEALQLRLSREPDLAPVRAVTSAEEALALVRRFVPDVAIVDVMLGASHGVELAARLAGAVPGTRVIMMTEVNDPDVVAEGLRAGARAWISKTVDAAELLRVIRGVAAGEAWLTPALLGAVLPRLVAVPAETGPGILDGLTVREREILQCMVDGLPRADIAKRLGLSVNTVRTHTQNLFAKIDAHSTLEAVAIAMRNGVRASAG